MNTVAKWHIRDLIQREAVVTYFQPIVSVREKRAVGVEALSRGLLGGPNGDLIAPYTLFEEAERNGVSRELDQLCSRRALESFAPLHHSPEHDLILFLNVHTTASEDLFGPEGPVRQAERLNIDPKAVAFEILESRALNTEQLRRTALQLRAEGFLVVMDDVGVGHSNFERLIDIRPDLIKIDKGIVRDLHRDYYKREIFRMLIGLADGLGGWVIAEGVETQEEALVALDLQADMIQGFHFGRPQAAFEMPIKEHLQRTAAAFKHYTVSKMQQRSRRAQERQEVVRSLAARLMGCPAETFERVLAEATAHEPKLLSAFILDQTGVQVTGTLWSEQTTQKQKALIFKPASRGADHAFKEYFYLLTDTGLDLFETHPYVPLPTGELAATLSAPFQSATGERFVLCAHLDVSELRHTPFDGAAVH